MDLDAPLDITIGPYETYNDEIFGYKAAFEAYVNVRDEAGDGEAASSSAEHMQEVENNLPIDPKYRNPKLGGAGSDPRGERGFRGGRRRPRRARRRLTICPTTSASFTQKGSKRVMLKNVQEAKFKPTLTPIAKARAARRRRPGAEFRCLLHAHPGARNEPRNRAASDYVWPGATTTPRQELKELYSAIEEAKADVTGLFMLQYLYDHKLLPGGPEPNASCTPRFWRRRSGRCASGSTRRTERVWRCSSTTSRIRELSSRVRMARLKCGTKIKAAVRDLEHDLLTLEATGDYAGAKRLLNDLGVVRPALKKVLDGLADLPTDIEPVFTRLMS